MCLGFQVLAMAALELENLTKDLYPKSMLADEVAKVRQYIKSSLESVEEIAGPITNSEAAKLLVAIDRLENHSKFLQKRIEVLEKKCAIGPPVNASLDNSHIALEEETVKQSQKVFLKRQVQPKRTMDRDDVELLETDYKAQQTNITEINLLTGQFENRLLPSVYDSFICKTLKRQQNVYGTSSNTSFNIESKHSSTEPEPVGQLALHFLIDNDLPLPAVHSYIAVGSERRTYQEDGFTINHFPLSYRPENNVNGHLRFALEFEPIDVGILYAALNLMGPDRITEWVNDEPNDKQSRRAWFFYETLTGKKLPLGDAQEGDFVDALLNQFHFVTYPRESLRHRVRDNMLGTGLLCPTLRRTPKLEVLQAQNLEEQFRRITAEYSSAIMTRAVDQFLIDETISSFALEGETPGHNQKNDFVRSLCSLSDFNPMDKSSFISLQNIIVKPNSRAQNWRNFQNFVGQQTREYGSKISFVTPRPEDVPYLMDGWMAMTDRLCDNKRGTVDAVLAAAVSAFSFVFIHPFADGNGRIHRYLIHFIFQKLGFTQGNTFLPVSSSILRKQEQYQAALEAFSKPVTKATMWEFRNDILVVLNETLDLFRFFDATPQAEFLYDRVADAIHHDLEKEMKYLFTVDNVCDIVKKNVQLPEKKTELLVRLLVQNNGKLSKNKRRHFSNIPDSILTAIEKEVVSLFEIQ